jgi:hypothetical protein
LQKKSMCIAMKHFLITMNMSSLCWKK